MQLFPLPCSFFADNWVESVVFCKWIGPLVVGICNFPKVAAPALASDESFGLWGRILGLESSSSFDFFFFQTFRKMDWSLYRVPCKDMPFWKFNSLKKQGFKTIILSSEWLRDNYFDKWDDINPFKIKHPKDFIHIRPICIL